MNCTAAAVEIHIIFKYLYKLVFEGYGGSNCNTALRRNPLEFLNSVPKADTLNMYVLSV